MEKVKAILKQSLPQVDFEKETNLVDKGVLDSLDIVTIISDLTAEFDVEIPPEEVTPENFNSLAQIQAMLDRLLDA